MKCLRLSEQHLNDGQLGGAYNMLVRAARYAPKGDLKSKAQQLETQLNETATQTLDDADQKYEQGEYVEALRSYQVVANMSKLKVSAAARKRIAKARKDPARQAQLREAKAARQFAKVETLKAWLSPAHRADSSRSAELDAEVLLAKLEGEAPDCSGCRDCLAWTELSPTQREDRILADRIKMAWLLEKIVKKYADTPTGLKSAGLLRGMLADEQFAAELDRDWVEENARKAYILAKGYKQNGVDQSAAKQLKKVLSHYSQTEWAKKARGDLEADPALAALVARTEAGALKPDKTSRAARVRQTAQEILARVPKVVSDQILDDTQPPDAKRYAHLLESIGPVLVNAAKEEVLTSSLQKQRRVLLYYTASWCGPCHKFTPKLKAFYEAHKTEANFEVVLVSDDESEEDMYRYMQKYKMPWLSVPMDRIEASGLMDEYDVDAIPHLVVIDGSEQVISNTVVDGRYLGPDSVLSDLRSGMDSGQSARAPANTPAPGS